jgi:hypothetical protein
MENKCKSSKPRVHINHQPLPSICIQGLNGTATNLFGDWRTEVHHRGTHNGAWRQDTLHFYPMDPGSCEIMLQWNPTQAEMNHSGSGRFGKLVISNSETTQPITACHPVIWRGGKLEINSDSDQVDQEGSYDRPE